MADKLGIYIHIPFCKAKCAYCDFYSLEDWAGAAKDYQKALLTHMKETAPLAKGYEVDTVYFGGGTPTHYGERRLGELLGAVKKYYKLVKGAEITVEANPESADERNLKRLYKAGFNRLSLGMQSAVPEELRAVGRIHTNEQTVAAVQAARKAKFKNLSLDLMYGLPGQTAQSWQESVEQALRLEPEHLSCYGLKVEDGTPLARRVKGGEVLPDDDAQADLYLWTVERLNQAGYLQYEISNFAKCGYSSRHNLRYWFTRPYIGFGPGAHSDFGGRRYSFVRDLDGYINGVLRGGTLLESNEVIPARDRGGEYLMLRLRTTYGIEEWEYRKQFFLDFTPLEERLEFFQLQGWAEKDMQGRWHLTPRGFLVSNQLIGDLMGRQVQPELSQTIHKAKERFGGQGQG